MGSYDAGSMNWGCSFVFDNNPQFLEELVKCYQEYDVKPEVEIFDMGMLGNVKHYIKMGLMDTPLYCQLVLGVLGGMEATVENLQYLANICQKAPNGLPLVLEGSICPSCMQR